MSEFPSYEKSFHSYYRENAYWLVSKIIPDILNKRKMIVLDNLV